jgi:hypothetical protein
MLLQSICTQATVITLNQLHHHLEASGHHQLGFAGLVHATEPAGVERRLV